MIQYPEDTLARYNFGLMAQTLGLINEAKKQYTTTIDKDKNNWQAQFNLYILYINEKNYNSALLLIDSVLELKSNFQPALRDKALVLNYLNKPDEAIKYIKKSIEINNFNAEVYRMLSKIYTFNVKEISKAK